MANRNHEQSKMHQVYSLEQQIQSNPELVAQAQALTLDQSRPKMGLRGQHGLFGTERWWSAIESGLIKRITREGRITRVYRVGVDPGSEANEVEFIDDGGSLRKDGLYFNHSSERKFYREGRNIRIEYALDESKKSQPSNPDYIRITLNVFIGE